MQFGALKELCPLSGRVYTDALIRSDYGLCIRSNLGHWIKYLIGGLQNSVLVRSFSGLIHLAPFAAQ